jgi:hypothetical protein
MRTAAWWQIIPDNEMDGKEGASPLALSFIGKEKLRNDTILTQ